MSFRFTWRGDELQKRWREGAQAAVNAVSKEAVHLCQEAVSTPYPPASTPGEPPHKRTGEGQAGIIAVTRPTSQVPEAYLTVRRSAKHMLYLEVGTRFVAARPWLKPTLIRYHRHLYNVGSQVYSRMLR